MNRTQIMSKLHKLLGITAAYVIDNKAPDADERAKYRARLPELKAAVDNARERMNARQRELLLGDPGYQALKAAYNEASLNQEGIASNARRYRIRVVTRGSIFTHVKAEGDTWPEVFRKLEDQNK